jgi:hypothetical protein
MVLYTITIYDWKMLVVLLSMENAVYGLVRRIEKRRCSLCWPCLKIHEDQRQAKRPCQVG